MNEVDGGLLEVTLENWRSKRVSHGNTWGKSRQAEGMARPKPWGRTGQVCGGTQEALGLK